MQFFWNNPCLQAEGSLRRVSQVPLFVPMSEIPSFNLGSSGLRGFSDRKRPGGEGAPLIGKPQFLDTLLLFLLSSALQLEGRGLREGAPQCPGLPHSFPSRLLSPPDGWLLPTSASSVPSTESQELQKSDQDCPWSHRGRGEICARPLSTLSWGQSVRFLRPLPKIPLSGFLKRPSDVKWCVYLYPTSTISFTRWPCPELKLFILFLPTTLLLPLVGGMELAEGMEQGGGPTHAPTPCPADQQGSTGRQ